MEARPDCKARDLVDLLVGQKRHQYEFNAAGEGCRYWATQQIDLFEIWIPRQSFPGCICEECHSHEVAQWSWVPACGWHLFPEAYPCGVVISALYLIHL